MRILGTVLIALGVAALVWGGMSFKTRETVFEMGPIKATADREQKLLVPPYVSAGVVGAGTIVLLVAARRRK